MGEKRQAKTTIHIRNGSGKSKKIEVFEGHLFPGKTFRDMQGHPVVEEREDFCRLRVDGKWWPAHKKVLFTKEEASRILMASLRV